MASDAGTIADAVVTAVAAVAGIAAAVRMTVPRIDAVDLAPVAGDTEGEVVAPVKALVTPCKESGQRASRAGWSRDFPVDVVLLCRPVDEAGLLDMSNEAWDGLLELQEVVRRAVLAVSAAGAMCVTFESLSPDADYFLEKGETLSEFMGWTRFVFRRVGA